MASPVRFEQEGPRGLFFIGRTSSPSVDGNGFVGEIEHPFTPLQHFLTIQGLILELNEVTRGKNEIFDGRFKYEFWDMDRSILVAKTEELIYTCQERVGADRHGSFVLFQRSMTVATRLSKRDVPEEEWEQRRIITKAYDILTEARQSYTGIPTPPSAIPSR
ncbi:MAG: hypothetical protein HYV40_02185 [Candidatus Levybacteria bacterium]|nr:hypothetical protein [Candidatus Levybacteria bacterium]